MWEFTGKEVIYKMVEIESLLQTPTLEHMRQTEGVNQFMQEPLAQIQATDIQGILLRNSLLHN